MELKKIKWFDDINENGEIGYITLRTGDKDLCRSIWWDAGGEHYFCTEDEYGELNAYLVSDFLN